MDKDGEVAVANGGRSAEGWMFEGLNRSDRRLSAVIFGVVAVIIAAAAPAAAGPKAPPPSSVSDIPATFTPAPKDQDFVRREAMIPMRDGVKLHAVLMIPKGAKRAPIILDRTPYNASKLTSVSETGPGAGRLYPLHAELFRAGYIVVIEDVRGKYESQGDYVMTRPIIGPLNATSVDHATDAFDTIDWLVRNVPETNGKVGTTGISYDGYTCLMALINPHPALKASAPIDPMVDGWMGDDWFHNGAFRQPNLEYVYKQSTTKASTLTMDEGAYDIYGPWLKEGSVDGMARSVGMEHLPYYERFLAHPAYDAYWSGQAVDKILGSRTPTVPTLIIHGQWDQEDIYGGPSVWKAVKPHDVSGDKLYLAIGPWNHGGAGLTDGAALGPIKFGSDTAAWFRVNVLIPFFDARLKDGAGPSDTAVVTAFETGVNQWRRYDAWPQSCAKGCPFQSKALYLNAKGGLDFTPSAAGADSGFDEFISDPARPVTYRARPIRPTSSAGSTWSQWLVDDQRFAEARPDVATHVSAPLQAPVRIAGQPIAHLFASTSGADADFVVKLIDVYPPEVPRDAALGGYELAVSMDILRGRYRDDPAKPSPATPNAATAYTLALPNADHVFLPGHRIMVQIQSSWFPLYDRNPQSWVDNIFTAPDSAYVKAVERIYRQEAAQSFIELPVAP